MVQTKRVAIVGIGGLSPLGHTWEAIQQALKSPRSAVQRLPLLETYEGLHCQLGAPVTEFTLPSHWDRKVTRFMGRVALLSTLASEMALAQAGLLHDPWLQSGEVGVSIGSSAGSAEAMYDLTNLLTNKNTLGLTASTYTRMMSHTAAANAALHFRITGRVIPANSACTSASQGIGHAYEAIKYGKQVAMLAGGAEEFGPLGVAIFDTLFATSQMNQSPEATPRPFDARRDGLVLGEGACTFVLEEWEHAQHRGAQIFGEIIGFGTNCDGTHMTRPNAHTMAQAMRLALQDADLHPTQIGYINAHGTATEHGDIAESQAMQQVFHTPVPIGSLKSFMGHTLGACGALETWMALSMMNSNWFARNLNLDEIDPRCGDLDFITDPEGRKLQTEQIMCNNFAFGGINTSLIIKRVQS